ncbi:MAG: hypothetical protein ISR55_11335 [Bacteroidetes bacterium]|nr:hypothetical protein [Bacteroidota bacterium]MBL6964408.1 hypothetical protein [Bacteroidota bacterium]
MKGPGFYFIQFFYGKYSSRLNRYCQQKDIPTPYNLCYHDDPDHHIFDILYRNDKYAVAQTEGEIKFQRTNFFTSRKKILKQYKPVYGYSIMEINKNTLRVYCFRKDIFGRRAKILFYFLNDVFIMGEYIFISYSPKKVSSVAQKLIQQQKLDYQYANENFYIENSNSERIIFTDSGFNLSIRYFSLKNKEIMDYLKSYFMPESEESKPDPIEWKRIAE